MDADTAWDNFKRTRTDEPGPAAGESIRKTSVSGKLDMIAAQLNDIRTDTNRTAKIIPQIMGDENAIEDANANAEPAPAPDIGDPAVPGGAPGGGEEAAGAEEDQTGEDGEEQPPAAAGGSPNEMNALPSQTASSSVKPTDTERIAAEEGPDAKDTALPEAGAEDEGEEGTDEEGEEEGGLTDEQIETILDNIYGSVKDEDDTEEPASEEGTSETPEEGTEDQESESEPETPEGGEGTDVSTAYDSLMQSIKDTIANAKNSPDGDATGKLAEALSSIEDMWANVVAPSLDSMNGSDDISKSFSERRSKKLIKCNKVTAMEKGADCGGPAGPEGAHAPVVIIAEGSEKNRPNVNEELSSNGGIPMEASAEDADAPEGTDIDAGSEGGIEDGPEEAVEEIAEVGPTDDGGTEEEAVEEEDVPIGKSVPSFADIMKAKRIEQGIEKAWEGEEGNAPDDGRAQIVGTECDKEPTSEKGASAEDYGLDTVDTDGGEPASNDKVEKDEEAVPTSEGGSPLTKHIMSLSDMMRLKKSGGIDRVGSYAGNDSDVGPRPTIDKVGQMRKSASPDGTTPPHSLQAIRESAEKDWTEYKVYKSQKGF